MKRGEKGGKILHRVQDGRKQKGFPVSKLVSLSSVNYLRSDDTDVSAYRRSAPLKRIPPAGGTPIEPFHLSALRNTCVLYIYIYRRLNRSKIRIRDFRSELSVHEFCRVVALTIIRSIERTLLSGAFPPPLRAESRIEISWRGSSE